MELKDAYQDKMNARLREWQAKIDALKARADQAKAGQKIQYYEEIESLRTKVTRDHELCIDRRAVTDLLPGQIHLETVIFFIDPGHGWRCNQDVLAQQPASGMDDEITYRPVVVIKIELFQLTDFPVTRLQGIPGQITQLV
jgi:hypothetical protein